MVSIFAELDNAVDRAAEKQAKLAAGPILNLNPGVDNRTSINPFQGGGQLNNSTFTQSNVKFAADEKLKQALRDAEAFKILSEAGGEAGASVSSLERKVKSLKATIRPLKEDTEQFKKLSAELKAAQKELRSAKVEAGIIQPRGGGRAKTPEVKAAEGSINALQKKVIDLTLDLENAPKDQVRAILGDLTKAETDLKAATDRLEAFKKSLKETVDIQPGESSVAAGAAELANAKLNQIVDNVFNGGSPDQAASDTTAILLEAAETRRIAAVDSNAAIVDDEEYTAERLIAIQQGLTEEDFKIREAARKKKKKSDSEDEKEDEARVKKQKERRNAAAEDVATGIGQFLIESGRAAIDSEQRLKEEALQKEYDRKIEAANGNVVQETQIKRDFEAKKLALDKASAKERQKLAVKEALINTALGIIRALATGNFFAAGAAAILGALQVAAIKKQKFARGGYTGRGHGAPDETGKRPVGIVHENEYVSPEWMVKHPVYGRHIGQLEGIRRRGFATGGFTSPPLQLQPLSLPGESRQQTVSIDAGTAELFAQVVAREVAKQTAGAVYDATASGNIEANRSLERNQRMNQNRTV